MSFRYLHYVLDDDDGDDDDVFDAFDVDVLKLIVMILS